MAVLQFQPLSSLFLDDETAWLGSAYDAARRATSADTDLPISSFPAECPFRLAQVEDAD